MTLLLRPYDQQDAAGFLRLSNLARGLQVPLAGFLEQETENRNWRQVAEGEGRMVAMAELRPFDYIPPGWLLLTLAVDLDKSFQESCKGVPSSNRAESYW